MKEADLGGWLAAQPASAFAIAQVLEFRSETFTRRIRIRPVYELTNEMLWGNNIGFSDTIAYQAGAIREDLIVLFSQEQVGSTNLILASALHTQLSRPQKVVSCA